MLNFFPDNTKDAHFIKECSETYEKCKCLNDQYSPKAMCIVLHLFCTVDYNCYYYYYYYYYCCVDGEEVTKRGRKTKKKGSETSEERGRGGKEEPETIEKS